MLEIIVLLHGPLKTLTHLQHQQNALMFGDSCDMIVIPGDREVHGVTDARLY